MDRRGTYIVVLAPLLNSTIGNGGEEVDAEVVLVESLEDLDLLVSVEKFIATYLLVDWAWARYHLRKDEAARGFSLCRSPGTCICKSCWSGRLQNVNWYLQPSTLDLHDLYVVQRLDILPALQLGVDNGV